MAAVLPRRDTDRPGGGVPPSRTQQQQQAANAYTHPHTVGKKPCKSCQRMYVDLAAPQRQRRSGSHPHTPFFYVPQPPARCPFAAILGPCRCSTPAPARVVCASSCSRPRVLVSLLCSFVPRLRATTVRKSNVRGGPTVAPSWIIRVQGLNLELQQRHQWGHTESERGGEAAAKRRCTTTTTACFENDGATEMDLFGSFPLGPSGRVRGL